ncbi:MAG: cation-transporting P-type ATPase, partial [Gammaproteobacteria bacterium]
MERRVSVGLSRVLNPARFAKSGVAHRSGRVHAHLVEVSAKSAQEVLDEFHTSIQGLTAPDAEERLEQCGANTVAREQKQHWLRQLARRIANPLNLLLIVLSIMSLVTGDLTGAGIIALMVVVAIGLAWIQEARSNRAAERLHAMVKTTATVLRQEEPEDTVSEEAGEPPEITTRPKPQYKAVRKQVPLDELVPGDLVQLSAGDMIPADVRLLSAKDLFINQSALTGESLPVEKFASVIEHGGNNALELNNLCFMGTNVVSGTAIALVVTTGAQTYFGSLADTLVSERVQTSFD